MDILNTRVFATASKSTFKINNQTKQQPKSTFHSDAYSRYHFVKILVQVSVDFDFKVYSFKQNIGFNDQSVPSKNTEYLLELRTVFVPSLLNST